MEIPAILRCDGYKTSHRKQYSTHTETVYSTWTPRKSRMTGLDKVVVFGLQYFIKDYLIDCFNETFFNRSKEEVMKEFRRTMLYYNKESDIRNWCDLYDLGYLPLKIDALEEGTLCPIRVPMFTIQNTKPEFYWLTNFIETIMSTEIWKPMTSATIALQYRKICEKWAEKTCDDTSHVDFQGHDFSMRGMAGLDAACSSGAGHLLAFKGTDTIPAVLWLEKYYNANCEEELIGTSIPATEHSVAETNIIELQEILNKGVAFVKNNILDARPIPENVDKRLLAELYYFNKLLDVYPSGTFSYVADTYNLWKVLTDILPTFKNNIMSRNGKVVIRPDSGDPCDIICGLNTSDYRLSNGTDGKLCTIENDDNVGKILVPIENQEYADERYKGVIELLWEVFGGTINSKGYKVLDPHIGCIYGDAITLERAEEICKRLESKGFASSNIVFGIGSYTYNMNTRDTFGFALKTTYGVVNGKELMLYKDPITDDGTKKSQKGMVAVYEKDGNLTYKDNLNKAQKVSFKNDLLKPLFEDGKLLREISLSEIREKLQNELRKEIN